MIQTALQAVIAAPLLSSVSVPARAGARADVQTKIEADDPKDLVELKTFAQAPVGDN